MPWYNSFQWYFLERKAETEHQGTENYSIPRQNYSKLCAEKVKYNNTKGGDETMVLAKSMAAFLLIYKQPVSLEITSSSDGCVLILSLVHLFLWSVSNLSGSSKQGSRHDILAHIWHSAPFLAQQCSKHKARSSPLLRSPVPTPLSLWAEAQSMHISHGKRGLPSHFRRKLNRGVSGKCYKREMPKQEQSSKESSSCASGRKTWRSAELGTCCESQVETRSFLRLKRRSKVPFPYQYLPADNLNTRSARQVLWAPFPRHLVLPPG